MNSSLHFLSPPQPIVYPHSLVEEIKGLSINVNQWADLGRVPSREGLRDTKLNFQDGDREKKLGDLIALITPDFLLGTEFFDTKVAQRLWQNQQQHLPYAVIAPNGGGIPQIVHRIETKAPRIFQILNKNPDNIVRLVNAITTSHYGTGETLGDVAQDILRDPYPRLVKAIEWYASQASAPSRLPAAAMEESAHETFINEDTQFRFFKWLLGGLCPWESGLAIFSRYPLLPEDTFFTAHPEVADLEHFTNKGILQTVMCLPDGKRVTLIVSHFQEGVSPRALAARFKQAQQLKKIADDSPYPVIIGVDFNDVAGSPSYTRFMNLSSYHDIFQTLYPHEEGITYDPWDDQNLIVVEKGATNQKISSERPSRIDFSFSDLTPLEISLLRHYDITDHKALLLKLGLERYYQIINSRHPHKKAPGAFSGIRPLKGK